MSEENKVSKAQQKAVNKYVKNNYDRVNVTFPKGNKEMIKDYAGRHGESVNSFIVRAVNETMERDGSRLCCHGSRTSNQPIATKKGSAYHE